MEAALVSADGVGVDPTAWVELPQPVSNLFLRPASAFSFAA
jgi:hypothetical protein